VYEFRYFADGRWFTDYAAFGLTRNPFREMNSVLRIPKVRPAVQEPASTRRAQGQRLTASA